MSEDKGVWKSTSESFFGFIEAWLQNLKLNILAGGSKAVSGIILGFTVLFLAIFFINLASIAAAIAIGMAVGGIVYGFLIVAGIYLLIIIFLFAFQKPLILTPVVKIFAKMLFEDEKNHQQSNQKV